MSRVLTFARQYPSYHPRRGESTYFVEKIWNSFHIDALGERFFMPFEEDLYRFNKHLPYDIYMDFRDGLLKSRTSELQSKYHTIRSGHRFKAGDWFSPRVWSGKPYNSKQIQFAPDIQVKRVWDFELTFDDLFYIEKELYAYSSSHDALEKLSKNDGLNQVDLINWFNKPFEGQIICWSDQIEY